MTASRFGNHERKRVVSELEKYFNVKLHKAGTRDIYLKDDNGKSYIVLGGIGDYHGIPKELFSEEEKQTIEGMLVIAKKNLKTIDIYSGSLVQLLKNRKYLTATDTQYQFDIFTKDEIIKLKQAPEVRLRKISTISYTPEEIDSDKTVHKAAYVIKKQFENLSELEKKRFFEELLHNK